MNDKSILLIGATGLVGNELAKLLSRDTYFQEITLLARRHLPEFDNIPKMKQIVIDFEKLDNHRNSIKAHCIVSTLGTTIKKAGSQENFRRVDFGYTLKTAEIGKINGAEHFILVSSLGANPSSKVFYNRIKGEVEQAVSNLGYKSVSIFRPSILLGKRKEFRLGEAVGKSFMQMFSFMLPKKYEPTEAYQLAQAILYISRKDEPGVKIYEADEIRDIYYKQI